jgi:tetratricopeptide (TPR) repeat protein
MRLLKNKYFFPIVIIGFLTGYIVANNFSAKVLPQPAEVNADITSFDFLKILGSQSQYYRSTISGNYLAGQFAQREKDWDTAYKYMSEINDVKDNTDLKRHLMVLAMAKGNLEEAQNIAQEIYEEDQENLLSVLFLTTHKIKQEDYAGAIESLNSLNDSGPATFLAPILKLWAQAGLGDLKEIDIPGSSFYAYHALLIHHYLDPSPALLDYALKAFNIQEVDLRDVTKFADLLVLSGQKKEALALYKVLEISGFANDKTKEKISVIEDKGDINSLIDAPVVTNAKEGAALVFKDMATILLREQSDDSAIIFARMSLALNPFLYQNKMIIGSTLAKHDQDNAAIKIFNEVPTSSDLFILSQRNVADIHTDNEEYDKAINILETLHADGDIDSLIQIGDTYRYMEEYDKAVKIYSQVLNNWDEVPEDYWHVYYSRGMSYERLKEYKKSESDLLIALQFQPNHPYVLNYLAYSWADQGINLDKSLSMLTLAAKLKPEDGYIADSLGWVYYKMHDFENAIPHLERAVELMPYDATLNDHLGDAYWQVGRKNEAKYQWERAVNYSEDNQADLKADVQEKLANGIERLEPANDNALSEVYKKDNGVF